jgi:mRNA deadenylase 3'-5' endonuclease subunit Ccr4
MGGKNTRKISDFYYVTQDSCDLDDNNSYRIASYNILAHGYILPHYLRLSNPLWNKFNSRAPRIVAEIGSSKPDILCLQVRFKPHQFLIRK